MIFQLEDSIVGVIPQRQYGLYYRYTYIYHTWPNWKIDIYLKPDHIKYRCHLGDATKFESR